MERWFILVPPPENGRCAWGLLGWCQGCGHPGISSASLPDCFLEHLYTSEDSHQMPPRPQFTSSPAHTAHEEGQEYQSPNRSRSSLDWRRGVGWPSILAQSSKYAVRSVSCSVCLQGEKWSKWTCGSSSICIYGCAGFSPAQLQGAASATTLQVMQCATSEPSASIEFIAISLSFHFMMSQQESRGFFSGSAVKNLPAMQETQAGDMGLIPGSGRSPGERKWQPTPVFLPGNSQSMGLQKSQACLGN